MKTNSTQKNDITNNETNNKNKLSRFFFLRKSINFYYLCPKTIITTIMKLNKTHFFPARLLFSLILFLIPLKLLAQPIAINPVASSYLQPKFGANLGTLFNHQDLLLDFGLGYEELGYDFSITLNGAFRPFYNRGRVEIGDQLYYQVRHKAVQFSIDLEKRFYFLQFLNYNKLGIYLGLKSAFAWDNYKGFSLIQNDGFAFLPNAGLSWQFSKISRLSVGYLYRYNSVFSNPNMINIKLSLYVNSDDDEN